MLTSFGFVLLLICHLGSISTFDDVNDDSITLNLEDNLDGKFSSFAKPTLRLSRQAMLDVTPSRSIPSVQYEGLMDELDQSPYYTLKVHFKRGPVQDHVMTSIPMCLVLQSQFQYTLTLFVNENGYIIGLQANTGNSTCSVTTVRESKRKMEYNYNVSIRLQLNEPGPQPEIQSFLEKVKRQQEAKLKQQESDNRPFILKYWKYILPVVVIFVLQGVFATEQGGNGGGAGQ